MGDFIVSIAGVPDSILEFLGYKMVFEAKEFRLYEDIFGEPHIVQRKNPLLRVNDLNDAEQLAQYAKKPIVFSAPPKN